MIEGKWLLAAMAFSTAGSSSQSAPISIRKAVAASSIGAVTMSAVPPAPASRSRYPTRGRPSGPSCKPMLENPSRSSGTYRSTAPVPAKGFVDTYVPSGILS